MRRILVVGNWKMNGSKASVTGLLEDLCQGVHDSQAVDLAVIPPYVFLPQVANSLLDTGIDWGAQNVCDQEPGAFTGEVSASMLKDFGCRYVIVGHSERRALYGETDELVAKKAMISYTHGLIPIICLGETRQEREDERTFAVISRQLSAILMLDNALDLLQNAVLAYEPVWAIGTGLTATPEQAQEVHAFIRKQLQEFNEELAQRLRILYGGSVKANNANALFAMPDVDGGLVGGASLNAQEFLGISQCNK